MHSGMNGNGTNGLTGANDPRLTSLDQWLNAYEVVKLPGGASIGMKPVNVLTLMERSGKIPTFIRMNLEVGTGKRKESPAPTAEDNMEMQALADNVIRAGLVYPPLVATEAEEREGKGITLLRFSINDKLAVLGWALGGAAAVEAANMFPIAETADVQPVPTGEDV
jgi:hypothetical protein